MKTKRFLAFLLTILMIGGLLPTVFAEDVAEVIYNPVYLITKDAYNCPDNYYNWGDTTYTLDRTKSTGYYKYVGGINNEGVLVSNDGAMPYVSKEANYGNAALILKASLDRAGVYDAKVDYTRFKYSGKIGLYFVPAAYADATWGDVTKISDISAVISDANTICVMDKVESNLQAIPDAGSANSRPDSYSIEGLSLKDKEYYVFIVMNKSDYQTNDGTRYYSAVKAISLDSRATIDVTGEKATMKPGESTQLSVSVTDENDALVTDAEISYESSNNAAVTVSDTGLVEAASRGNATITVSAKVGDITVSECFDVSCEVVWNPKYVFKNAAFNTNAIGTNLWLANSFDYIKTDVSAPWCIVANHNMTNKYINANTAFFCTDPIVKFADNAVVMKIATDAPGIYQPTLTFTKTSENGKLDMYFISAADVAASGLDFSTMANTKALIGKSKLGISVDQAPNSSATSPVTGESFYLPAGESYIIMVTSKGCDTTSNGSGYYYCYFSELALNHVEGFDFKVSNNNIAIGKSATLSATALDAEGNALPGAITFESSDPSVAKISGNTVIGVDEGKATITAKVEGTSYSAKVDVSVSAVWDPKYVFTAAAVKELKVPSDKAPALNNIKELREDISTGIWEYVSDKNIYASGLYDDGLQHSVKEENFNNNAIIFKLSVDKPGTFVPTLSYMRRDYCGRQNVYLIPTSYADAKWNLKDAASFSVPELVADENVVKIASVNLYVGTNETVAKTYEGSPVNIDENSVYLMFVLENNDEGIINDSGTKLWGYPETLTLTKTNSISAASADTALEVGEKTTLSAKAYDNRDNEISAEVTYENLTPGVVTVSGNTVTAVAVGDAKIKATATIDGVAVTDTVTIKVTPKQISVATQIGDDYSVGQWIMGAEVKVTAPEISGKVFRYWVLGTEENGIPVSESATYTFKALTNTYLTAVYSDAVADDAKVVEFYLENGGFVGSAVANEEGKVELPDAPSITGYVFSAWMTDAKTAFTADTIVEDLLTKVVGTFNAETITDTEYSYGDKIENKSDTAKIWKRNDKVVAYGTEYTYYVWADFEITSEDGVRPEKPIIVLDNNGKRGGARMIEYDANGFEIVEAGILFGDGYNMTVDSCQYKAKSNRNLSHGQFTAKPPVEEGYTTARGYVVYVDANGDYQVVYSH
ncbi:MAG: Ig-like domain-containing protein [Oscillospiraceae bacterium]|nr:Ig-like domain-containing protein [Oscillospiraceae bacterium]